MWLMDLLRAAVPRRVKGYLRGKHREHALAGALREVAAAPPGAALGDELLDRLVYGWGNEGWSARGELLGALTREAAAARGAVLECGSGLSTVLLGVATRGTGRRVVALEHHPEWAARVRAELARQRLRHVEVMLCELRPLGAYTWYAPRKDDLPADVGLVVCDGPPDSTPGGRYGLLPEVRSRLAPGCVILLDDAERPGEQEILRRWAGELGAGSEITGVVKPYGRVVVPATS